MRREEEEEEQEEEEKEQEEEEEEEQEEEGGVKPVVKLGSTCTALPGAWSPPPPRTAASTPWCPAAASARRTQLLCAPGWRLGAESAA